MKTFPAIVTGIFAALAVGAVIIFATFSAGNRAAVGTVVIWGSLPHSVVDTLINNLNQSGAYSGVTYQVVPPSQLVPQLVQAIASGKGPDLVIFPEENLVGQSDKLQVIPYSTVSKRSFQDAFLQVGEAFLGSTGSYGLPFTIDPLVMYWNRSLFAAAGLANPPQYWDEISDMAPKLSKADKNGTLVESAVSFGTWGNVEHAKAILVSILGELGDPVIAQNSQGAYQSVFIQQTSSPTLPADSTLRFYTDFADPTKPLYSWNSSMPDSKDAFVAGKLAIYFGYASELSGIRAANPNLNFDVAPVPAIRGGGNGAYAAITALVVPRGAQNPTGALAVAQALTAAPSQGALSQETNLPSVRRDVSPQNASDPYATTFRNAALQSFSFLDPDPSTTDSIFQRMVENVTSGKLQVSASTAAANQDLQALLGTPGSGG